MNIILAISYRYLLIAATVFVVGCSHPLKISGEGDIVSSSGTHSCTLESQPCANFVANDYKETYTAVARVGYKFVEWQGCGDQFPSCSFDIKADVINQYWFQTMPALTAIFSKKDSEKDISPDRFSFIDQTGVLLNLERISAGITVSGIDGPAPISIVRGMYSINDAEFTRSVGTVNNGDVIRVSTFSSMSFNTSTQTILNIGGITDDFVTSTVSEAVGLSPTLGTSYVIDETLSLILYNGAEFELGSSLIIGLEIVEIHTSDRTLIKGKAYSINYKGYPFVLYRTELPIIYLDTGDEKILDDPKISGNLILLERGEENFESLIGIEIRGGTSQSFPKKSFSMELWEDLLGSESYKEKLLNLRKDDDWILDGLWNEPLRLRDFVSHSLWLKIGRYPHAEEEPNLTLGIEKKFCELFLNGHYRGVYYLGEKVDRKQLKLEKYDDGLTGELYKGSYRGSGITFDRLDSYSNNNDKWSGYEAKYPDEIGEIDWSNLHSLVDFVVNSNKTTFDTSIGEKVYLKNMADYYIFLNILYATDNRGRNVYTARYDQSSTYFFVPWDMDGSFGTNWRGKRTNITNKILSNGLFRRLIENQEFKNEVKARWDTLKTGVLSVTALQNIFSSNYEYLKSNGIYEREALDLELPQLYSEQEIDFIHDWIERRFTYLDSYFEKL